METFFITQFIIKHNLEKEFIKQLDCEILNKTINFNALNKEINTNDLNESTYNIINHRNIMQTNIYYLEELKRILENSLKEKENNNLNE